MAKDLKKSTLLSARSLVGLAVFGGVALAACSSAGGSSNPAAQTGSANTVVAVHGVSGTGQVLTNSKGRTLYMSEQEKSGKLMCTSSKCLTFWMPLTVTGGQQPTGPSDVSSMLSTVTRPDGSKQVTFNGVPLYTFSFDHSAGDAKGNDFKDSFDGVNFTWHAATANGAAAPAPSTSSNNGGGFGY